MKLPGRAQACAEATARSAPPATPLRATVGDALPCACGVAFSTTPARRTSAQDLSRARARAESCAHGAPPERARTVLEHLQQRQAGDVHLLGSVHERCVDLGRAAHPHARLIEHALEALHGRWQGARALLRPTPAAGLTPHCRHAHERERARRSSPAPTPDPRASSWPRGALRSLRLAAPRGARACLGGPGRRGARAQWRARVRKTHASAPSPAPRPDPHQKARRTYSRMPPARPTAARRFAAPRRFLAAPSACAAMGAAPHRRAPRYSAACENAEEVSKWHNARSGTWH